MTVRDPYKALGLSYGADKDAVTKAYRTLAKKYHPDLNPGDEAAAERMREINAAYDMIKNGWTPSAAQDETPRARPNADAYGGDPFDPLEELLRRYGFRTYRSGGAREQGYGYGTPYTDQSAYGGAQGVNHPRFDAVRRLLETNRFEEALWTLEQSPERDAPWYYLSALANLGLGRRVTAIAHAETAARLDPGEPLYAALLNRLAQQNEAYRAQSEAYGRTGRGLRSPILWCCIGNLLINFFANLFCGGGWGCCC